MVGPIRFYPPYFRENMFFCLVVMGVYPPYTLSGPTTKKNTFFMCVFPYDEKAENVLKTRPLILILWFLHTQGGGGIFFADSLGLLVGNWVLFQSMSRYLTSTKIRFNTKKVKEINIYKMKKVKQRKHLRNKRVWLEVLKIWVTFHYRAVFLKKSGSD